MQFKGLNSFDVAFIRKSDTKGRSARTTLSTERERYAFSSHLFIAL